MKLLQTGSVLAATTIMTIFPLGKNLVATAAEYSPEPPAYLGSSVVTNRSSQNDSTTLPSEGANNHKSIQTKSVDYPLGGQPDLSYLAFYPYAELPPATKPADVVLDSLSDVPIGTPLEEIKRASDAFALDFSFMTTIAKIESDFNPKQRTGSYVGLFQLSKGEFAKYGSGDITSPRDNAIAAAYKFTTEAILFESDTHKKPSFSDLYLITNKVGKGLQNT